MTYVYVVHELDGGHVVEVFKHEEDAKSFLHWEYLEGNLTMKYVVSKIPMRG